MDISRYIWEYKYKAPEDKTVQDTFSRVANAIADTSEEFAEFYEAMSNYKFIPGGRILANAGRNTNSTMANCFVMPRIEDSIDGIFDSVWKSAKTLQAGGGIGLDFSTIRPNGHVARKIGGTASGPVSFMKVWNATCETIMAAGNRRGAMMAVLRCDHPDVLEFINSKREKGNGLTNFNISVAITNEFMEAYPNKYDVTLTFGYPQNDITVHHTVDTKLIMDTLVDACYESAEPGVIFIDHINLKNKEYPREIIYATNPCGEQPLPPNGACVLGSINLPEMLSFNKEGEYYIDFAKLKSTAHIGSKFLNKVIDKSVYPLPEQREEALEKRRIGLGVMGLGSTLSMLGIPYGSEWSRTLTREIMSTISTYAKAGAPNSTHTTCVAPTGTTAMFAHNVSSGIEPIFSMQYDRNVRMPDGSTKTLTVKDYALVAGAKDKTTVQDLTWKDHIHMMESVQKYVDGAVSKTINCPSNMTKDEFLEVILHAHTIGLKGVTLYRPNDVTGEVLVTAKAEKKDLVPTLKDRPEVVSGFTHKIKHPLSDSAMYVTINEVDGEPLEIFFNSKDVSNQQWANALSRTISAIFRKGGDCSFVAEELKAIFDPSGGYWRNGTYYPSLVADIGSIIEVYISRDGCGTVNSENDAIYSRCPKCGTLALTKSEGCEICHYCGYSKCG